MTTAARWTATQLEALHGATARELERLHNIVAGDAALAAECSAALLDARALADRIHQLRRRVEAAGS